MSSPGTKERLLKPERNTDDRGGFFSDLDIFLEGGDAEPGMLMAFLDWKSFLDWITQFTPLSMNPWFTFFSSNYWVVSFTWLIKMRITN